MDSDDLMMLRTAAREWMAAEHPAFARHEDERAAVATTWRAISGQGWTGVVIPEDFEGSGLGLTGFAVLAEELGRELACLPFTASALLAPLALTVGQGEWLTRIATGEAIIAFAHGEGPSHTDVITTYATSVTDGWCITGTKDFVADALVADAMLVTARVESELAVFFVPSAAAALLSRDTIDGRGMADVRLDRVVLPKWARLPLSEAEVVRLCDLARLGCATELLGAARRALEITTAYLGTREQFGVPIGSFQALQHRMAQVHVEIELAAACLAEAWDFAMGCEALTGIAALARHQAAAAAGLAAREMIQMHGGIGMTAEHLAGRYLKWIEVTSKLHGSDAAMVDQWADSEGI